MFKVVCKDQYCSEYNIENSYEDNPGKIECGICYSEMTVTQVN